MNNLIFTLIISLNLWAQEKMDWNTWQHQQAELEKQFNQLSTEIKQKPGDPKELTLIGVAQEVQISFKNRILAFQEKINSLETDCQYPKKRIPHPISLLKFTQISNGIKGEKAPDPKALDLIAISKSIQEKQNIFMKEQRERIEDLSAGCTQLSQMGAGKQPKPPTKTKTKRSTK